MTSRSIDKIAPVVLVCFSPSTPYTMLYYDVYTADRRAVTNRSTPAQSSTTFTSVKAHSPEASPCRPRSSAAT